MYRRKVTVDYKQENLKWQTNLMHILTGVILSINSINLQSYKIWDAKYVLVLTMLTQTTTR